jgi:hypothetical protein
MEDDITRTFKYATEFYLKRLGLIVVFSIPFIFAFLIPVIVSAPSYLSLGGVFLRTGSIPELSPFDIALTAVAYAVAVFLIADTIVNINLIVRSKRTLNVVTQEVLSAMGSYAMRIFYIYTVALLLLVVVQLITYDMPLRTWIYPIFAFLLSYFIFFVPPAVVIDNSDTPTALRRSIYMALKNPHFFLLWVVISLFVISVLKVFADFLFASPFSGYFLLLVNSLLILPYLTVLQTQMYMEKYPLAR